MQVALRLARAPTRFRVRAVEAASCGWGAGACGREVPGRAGQGVGVRFIGRRDRAPEALRRRMESMEDRTELNTRLGRLIAFDCGFRFSIARTSPCHCSSPHSSAFGCAEPPAGPAAARGGLFYTSPSPRD